jgi:hypothetical protein
VPALKFHYGWILFLSIKTKVRLIEEIDVRPIRFPLRWKWYEVLYRLGACIEKNGIGLFLKLSVDSVGIVSDDFVIAHLTRKMPVLFIRA